MAEQKSQLISYLLGELSEDEQASLEAAYFSDPQMFERLVAVENELVDSYALGRLQSSVRQRFEEHYLGHPDRKERALFAVALANTLEERKVPGQGEVRDRSLWSQLKTLLASHKSALAYAAAVGSLVLLVGVVWLWVQSRRLRQELAQSQIVKAEQEARKRDLERLLEEKARTNDTEQQTPTPRPAPSQSTAPSPATPPSVMLALVINGARGPASRSVHTLTIPRGTQEVHLKLTLKENDYTTYEAVLQPVGGDPVYTRRGLRPVPIRSGASLILSVSPSLLSSGDYMLTLKGITNTGEIEDVSKSLFQVVKK